MVAFWGGGEAELDGWGEVVEDAAPGAFVGGSAGEEDAAVFGDATFFADFVGVDAHKGVFEKGTEGVVGLVGKDVTIEGVLEIWIRSG